MTQMFGKSLGKLLNKADDSKNQLNIKFIKNQEQIKKRIRLISKKSQKIINKSIKTKSLGLNSEPMKGKQSASKSIQLLAKLKITKKNQQQQLRLIQQESKQAKNHQYDDVILIKQVKYRPEHQKCFPILQQQKKERTKLTLTKQNNPFHQAISIQPIKIASILENLIIKSIDNKRQQTKKDLQIQKKYQKEVEAYDIITRIMSYLRQKTAERSQQADSYTQKELQKVCYYLLKLLFTNNIHISFKEIRNFLDTKFNHLKKNDYLSYNKSNGFNRVNKDKLYQNSQILNNNVNSQYKCEQNHHQTSISYQKLQIQEIGLQIKNQNQLIIDQQLKNQRLSNKENKILQQQSQNTNTNQTNKDLMYPLKMQKINKMKHQINNVSIQQNYNQNGNFSNRIKQNYDQSSNFSSRIKQNYNQSSNFSNRIKLNFNLQNKSNSKLKLNKISSLVTKQSTFKQKQKQRLTLSISNKRATSKNSTNRQYQQLKQEKKINKKIKIKIEEEKQLNQIIQQKQKCLVIIQEKIQKAKQALQKHKCEKLQAQTFLQSIQCTKSIQKIIRKKGQIQKNLQNLITNQVFNMNNLERYSDPQYIKKTKQEMFDKWNSFVQSNQYMSNFKQKKKLMASFQQILFNLWLDYSQIIKQFQEKTSNAKNHYYNFIEILRQWQIDNAQRQKLSKNCCADYYASQEKILSYIQTLPSNLAFIQKALTAYDQKVPSQSKQNKQEAYLPHINAKELLKRIQKICDQSQLAAFELHKQKRFAKVLKQII